MVEAVSTAVVDFTVVAGFAAAAASEAERDSAAAAGFVAARSAGVRAFAEGRDFTVERSAAAFTVTASAADGAGADAVGVGEDGAGVGTGASASAGAGRIGVGLDTRIRTDMGTTRGGRRLITRPAMIPTTILTTTLRPPILRLPMLRLPTRIEIIHTGPTGTGMLRRRARHRDPPMTRTTGPATETTCGRRPHQRIPGRRRRIPTVRQARMA